MNVLDTISELERIEKGCVLSIGNFDGVRLGHQEILASARKAADNRGVELVAMTFEPHPVAILFPERAPGVLTPLELKSYLLSQCGVDSLVVLKDNPELLDLTPEDFISRFLVEKVRPSMVVEGTDFNFGVGRTGNVDTLMEMGPREGFDTSIIQPKKIKLSTGQMIRVSSTMIRYMLESGHVADACAALGRPYRLLEEIIPGRGIGKKLGFPTLNMRKPKQVLPAEEVYTGFVKMGDTIEDILTSNQAVPAAYSIGQARTYGEEFPLLIEAHLLKKNLGNITQKYMAMDFIQRIRSQHKFKTPDDLSKQIARDCEQAKDILGSLNNGN